MEKSTDEKILEAAKIIFTKKGFAGARMQEIADEAGINKGLLHYYYKSKRNLFLPIFEKDFKRMVGKINHLFDSQRSLFGKIESFIDIYLDMLIENPHLPGFIMHELHQNPKEFVENLLEKTGKPNPFKMVMDIQHEVEAGRIHPVNPVDLVINIIGLCAFPFIAKPMIQGIISLDEKSYVEMMENRKAHLKKFVINAIKKQ